ncbi:MAG: VOC family protein [Candidatus Saccharibacteria bacterium]
MLEAVNSILFYSSDTGKTAEFYRTLGFTVGERFGSVTAALNGFELVFVDKNKAEFQKEAQTDPKGVGVFLYVQVDDVDQVHRSLVDKGVFASTPRNWPWGNREFVVKDPDGYKLIFYRKSVA